MKILTYAGFQALLEPCLREQVGSPLGLQYEQQSVVVMPAAFMRTYGLAIVAASFLVTLVISLRRFRERERAAAH